MAEPRRDAHEETAKDEQALSIRNPFEVVWKRFWIIAVVAIVLAAAAVGASFLQTPRYEASVQILVGQGGLTEAPSEAMGLQQLTQTMVEIANSRPVSEAVIEELDLGTDVDDFVRDMSVSQVSATQVIEISYEHTDPQMAAEISNTIGEAFSDQVADMSNGETPITATILSRAEVPEESSSPQPVRNGILALALGAIFGVGLALLMEYFDDSWHSPEEAERVSGVPTFGIIPEFAAVTGKRAMSGGRRRASETVASGGGGSGRSVEKMEYQDIARDGRVVWPLGMILADARGRVEEASPALREMLGFSEEEVQGADFSKFATHPDDVKESAQALKKLVSGERDHYRIEKRCIKKDGQLVWTRFTVSAIRGPEGDIRFFVAMIEDITERKQAEESLRLSKEFRRAIVGVAPLIVHSFTPDGFSLMSNESNEAWDRFWDEGEETNGSNLFDDERLRSAGLTPYIEKSVKGGDLVTTPTLHYEKPRNGRPGAECWVNAFIRPIRDEVGRVAEVVIMLEDVTECKQAEEELRESSAERGQFERELQKACEDRQELEEHLRQNIAGRKRAEKALRESEGEFRSFIRFAADMLSKEKKGR